MNKQLAINTDVVVKYLLMAQGPLKGVSVLDICGATGLSRSTVYRVIKLHPAIETIGSPGRKQLYRLNVERLSEAALSEHASKQRPLIVDEAHAKVFEGLGMVETLKKCAAYIVQENPDGISYHRADLKRLGEVVNNSIDFVNGKDSIDPSLIAPARRAVEEVMLYAAMLQITLGQLIKDPRFTDDENFWQLFATEAD